MEELTPFEPRPNPFQSFLHLILQFNQNPPSKEMATNSTETNTGSSTTAKMALPQEFSGKKEELNQFVMSCLAHLVINREMYDANKIK